VLKAQMGSDLSLGSRVHHDLRHDLPEARHMRKKEGHLAPRPHRSNIGEDATRCRQVEHRALPSVMMRRCKNGSALEALIHHRVDSIDYPTRWRNDLVFLFFFFCFTCSNHCSLESDLPLHVLVIIFFSHLYHCIRSVFVIFYHYRLLAGGESGK